MSRHDDHRDRAAGHTEVLLEIEARHPAEMNIHDQTHRVVTPTGGEKRLGAIEQCGFEPSRSEQTAQRVA